MYPNSTIRKRHKPRIASGRPVGTQARFDILKRDDYRCRICGTHADENVRLEVDHIVPRAKGGTNDSSNLWTLCWACNNGKSDTDLYDAGGQGNETGLFPAWVYRDVLSWMMFVVQVMIAASLATLYGPRALFFFISSFVFILLYSAYFHEKQARQGLGEEEKEVG